MVLCFKANFITSDKSAFSNSQVDSHLVLDLIKVRIWTLLNGKVELNITSFFFFLNCAKSIGLLHVYDQIYNKANNHFQTRSNVWSS